MKNGGRPVLTTVLELKFDFVFKTTEMQLPQRREDAEDAQSLILFRFRIRQRG